ncbi:hypothetical protein H311_01618 [Anncaliia algerae PRA109]|nr:hypothetical protein H311_01618 [Anncaliia algerae PRA109]
MRERKRYAINHKNEQNVKEEYYNGLFVNIFKFNQIITSIIVLIVFFQFNYNSLYGKNSIVGLIFYLGSILRVLSFSFEELRVYCITAVLYCIQILNVFVSLNSMCSLDNARNKNLQIRFSFLVLIANCFCSICTWFLFYIETETWLRKFMFIYLFLVIPLYLFTMFPNQNNFFFPFLLIFFIVVMISGVIASKKFKNRGIYIIEHILSLCFYVVEMKYFLFFVYNDEETLFKTN